MTLKAQAIQLARSTKNASLKKALTSILALDLPGEYLALDSIASDLERMIDRFPNLVSQDLREEARLARLKAREAYKNRAKKADQDDPTYWYGLAPREPAIDAPALQPKEAKRKR